MAFDLPKNIERYIAALSKLYAQDGERLLQEILVNAHIRVEEERITDNWNGGTYGHGLFLTLPETIFLKSAKERGTLQERITQDLNKLHNSQNEHICDVFLEMQLLDATDWRAQGIRTELVFLMHAQRLHRSRIRITSIAALPFPNAPRPSEPDQFQ